MDGNDSKRAVFVHPAHTSFRYHNSFAMNHSQYHYKGMDPDLDEYLSEYKNQTPMESDDYAGK